MQEYNRRRKSSRYILRWGIKDVVSEHDGSRIVGSCETNANYQFIIVLELTERAESGGRSVIECDRSTLVRN